MFHWDKSINAINIPANRIVALFRSMREVQLALPGVSAQEAIAFLCQYHMDGGVATIAVFHLYKSRVLAFYRSDPQVVPEQNADSLLDQGLNFVESMGFLMTDQDLHLLNEADQEMLWASLPLSTGLSNEVEQAQVSGSASQTEETVLVRAVKQKVEANEVPVARVADNKSDNLEVLAEVQETVLPQSVLQVESDDNVDDLLVAVEAMRAKRSGLRARKIPPTDEEMDRRHLQLRETIGRILASL
jgi:hypothetical protein